MTFPIGTTPNMGRAFHVGLGTVTWVVIGERPGDTVTGFSLRSHVFRTFGADSARWVSSDSEWRRFREAHRGKEITEADDAVRRRRAKCVVNIRLNTLSGETSPRWKMVRAALVLDDYAVTPSVDGGEIVRGDWSVTHRQSGCAVTTHHQRDVAIWLARKIQAIAPGLTLPERVTKKTPASKEARRLVGKINALLASAESYS